METIAETGARRVVIDSLSDLAASTSDSTRFNEFVHSLVQRCAHDGVSLMFTYEIAELFNIVRFSETGISHLADNVVLLQYVRDGADIKGALTIIKARASSTATTTREFCISAGGITLGEPIDPDRGPVEQSLTTPAGYKNTRRTR